MFGFKCCKMRSVYLIAAAILLLGYSANVQSSQPLKPHYQDFAQLWPLGQMQQVAYDYVVNDEGYKKTRKYLESPEFLQIWDRISKNKEFKHFVDYLESANVPLTIILSRVNGVFGQESYPMQQFVFKRTGGFNGFLDDITSLLPRQQLFEVFKQKVNTYPEFKYMYEKLNSREFQRIITSVKTSSEVLVATMELRKNGIDVLKYIKYIRAHFGLA